MTKLENNLLIAIPVKNLRFTKTRLSKVLSLGFRIKLTNFLLSQLINKIDNLKKDLNKTINIALITSNKVSAKFIDQNNNIIISDNGAKSLSEAVEIARDYASKKKFKALCFLPSDLENPLEKDLKKFMSPPYNSNEMRICPSNSFGTNALLISLLNNFEFKFGISSFHKHIAIGSKLKLQTTILKLDSLTFDIDEPKDLKQAWFNMNDISKINTPSIIF
jgi:2-phospho-L-lactate guanylyltransferase